ncbi:universal stress protein [Nocardioides aurantiacus]|uniref:Nucleotide-binding universal stress UspA family protein n=1 Tax=Nocardioides aurantiacus TaxID=86796 RepID=A0A3N2CQV9_9ACTN|nr:universal stress protein [Nocardioides aurantiacus]ROR89912.1 nucleotide-binding universal stress UspA family protein [Nocardioides aurantiacus]
MSTVKVATEVDARGGILVGDDGSPASQEGVRWAADLAGRLGETLHVVRAWSISSAPRPASATGGYVPPLTDFEQAVLDRLREDVAAAGVSEGDAVQLHVVHGAAGRRLLEAAAHADMLVVGTRGAGGFLGLRMGSTADQVMRHAPCPVVVVPVHGDDDPDDLDTQVLAAD